MNNLYYNDKKLKQITKKRTQKTKKVWGWILTAVGLLELPSAIGALSSSGTAGLVSGLISCALFLIPGLYLLLTSKRQVDKWDRYEAIIDNRGNTPISLIAKKMNLSEQQVYQDLQEMIHSDFFIGPNYNIEAYIDAERDLLVMASGGEPLKPLPDPPTEEERRQQAQQGGSFWKRWGSKDAKAGPSQQNAAGSYSGESDANARNANANARNANANARNANADAGQFGAGHASANTASTTAATADAPDIEDENLTDLEQIQQAIARTKDDEVRGYLYGLEGSVRRIDERLQDQPELQEKLSIKRLYKYYLPQVLELIRKYLAPDTPADLKEQIKEALQTSANALSNIEADLLEREQMDAEVDIEVLKNMFAQDGLLDRVQTGAAQGAGAQPQAQAQPQPQPQAQAQAQPQPQPQPQPQGR